MAFIPFKKDISSSSDYFGLRADYFFHPYSNIEKIEKGKKKLPPTQGKLKFLTKNYRKFKILIMTTSTFCVATQYDSLFERLQSLIRVEKIENFFAFSYRGLEVFDQEAIIKGWEVFRSENLMKEFQRQGIAHLIQPSFYEEKQGIKLFNHLFYKMLKVFNINS